jgi:hypothetical protein
MKFKLIAVCCLLFFTSISAVSITRETYQLSDLNVDIAVAVEGSNNPELEYTNSIVNKPKSDESRIPNLDTTPLDVTHGSVLKLKIYKVDKAGIKTDITNDRSLKLNVVGSSAAHICDNVNVCIWPQKAPEFTQRDSRFRIINIEVSYFSEGGKFIGQNGFRLNVLPDPGGRNINPPLPDAKPKPSTLKTKPVTDQTWQQIKKLKGIATQSGMATPSLYVFFDPNCPYCTDLWKKVLPVKPSTGSKPAEIQKAEFFSSVPAVWIPVAYMNDTSLGKSASLLRQNTQTAIDNNFQTAKYKEKQGGAVAVVPTEAEKNALSQAKALWLELGGATPLMVYRNKAGGMQLVMGVPTDDQLVELLDQLAASTR